jgi:hypothetical protein
VSGSHAQDVPVQLRELARERLQRQDEQPSGQEQADARA